MKILEKLQIETKNESFYRKAFTHTSYANEEKCDSYERLEFLGDAVLELIMSEYFYKFTNLLEGDMSKTRASYVCEGALFEYSKKINLIPAIRVGHGLDHTNNETIIAEMEKNIFKNLKAKKIKTEKLRVVFQSIV